MKFINSSVFLFFYLYSLKVLCNRDQDRRSKYLNFFDFYPPVKPCECGIPNTEDYYQRGTLRIIGGSELPPNKYPWLVLLTYNSLPLCGGTIISDLYILSAAHCWKEAFAIEDLKAIVGVHNRCEPTRTTVSLSISKIIRHKKFDQENFNADIMLLRLIMRLSFNKYIRPVCLPFYARNTNVVSQFVGQNGLVIGWGATNNTLDELPCTPRQLYVPVLTKKQCPAEAPSLFCAGFVEGGRDACRGDSGGPLQLKNNLRRYEIIGIVSAGFGCALPKYPGEYTDVIQFIPWILNFIKDSTFCF